MNSRKTCSIGLRTHKDILEGKNIRKTQDEGDMFEDYWSDSESDSPDEHSDISSKTKASITGKNHVIDFSKKKCETEQTKNSFKIPVHDSPSKNKRFSKQSMNPIMNSNVQIKSPSNIVAEDSPSKNTRLSKQSMNPINSNVQIKSPSNIVAEDGPSKNTRLGKQSMNPIMNSNVQIKSPSNIVAEDSPSKNTRLSQQPEMNLNTQTESPFNSASNCNLTSDTRLGRKSITSQFPQYVNEKTFIRTPNNHYESVLAELNEDLAPYQKTNNRKSETNDAMLENVNLLSKTKILDPKSSNLSDAIGAGKETPVLEKEDVSSKATDANMLSESTARTETILQPNEDTDSTLKLHYSKKLSLIPRKDAELLKEKERKAIRVTRSYKPVNAEEQSVEQCDEYDKKLLRMIEEAKRLNSSHKSSVKESTVEINKTSSLVGKNLETSTKRKISLTRAPRSHKKTKTDLIDKGYISKQVMESGGISKENFELLNERQNENDDTLPIISDVQSLNKTHTIQEALESKNRTSSNNKNLPKAKKDKEKNRSKNIAKINPFKDVSGQSNVVAPDKFVKNSPLKANKNRLTERSVIHQDENNVDVNQPETSYSTHEMASFDTAENEILEQIEKEVDKQIVGSNKRKSVAYTQRKNVTNGCEIVNLKSLSKNNTHSPKKRKLIAHKKNTTVESVPLDLIEHGLNDDNIQNKEPSILEHEQEDNADASVHENSGTAVSNECSKNYDNIAETNQLPTNDAILSHNSLATNVSELASIPEVPKKHNHKRREIVPNADHGDKQHSNKRKDQSKNIDGHSSVQKTTKSQKLIKNKTKQDTYNLKQNEQQKEQSENYIRRSTRTKYRPLASWKNERLLYGFKNGAIEIFGLDPGTKASDHIAEELEKRNYFKVSTSKKKSTKLVKPKKAKLVDLVFNKQMKLDVHKKFDLIPWHVPSDGTNAKKTDYAYRLKKYIETPSNSFGFLEIPVGKEKPTQYFLEEDINLTVFRGKVKCVIQENSYTMCTKDTIFVPRGTPYCLKNIGSVSALISFVVGNFKIPHS